MKSLRHCVICLILNGRLSLSCMFGQIQNTTWDKLPTIFFWPSPWTQAWSLRCGGRSTGDPAGEADPGRGGNNLALPDGCIPLDPFGIDEIACRLSAHRAELSRPGTHSRGMALDYCTTRCNFRRHICSLQDRFLSNSPKSKLFQDLLIGLTLFPKIP